MKLSLDKNDRICFLGDSITADGRWISEVTEYFVSHYPELKIGFYNCGIAGGTSTEANLKDRMYFDCFNLFPKYVVIMYGMNDTGIWLYPPELRDKNTDERRTRITQFRDSMENIIALCRLNNAIPILCTPTPYDEYTKSDRENLFADAGLKECRRIVLDLAKKYDLECIDMQSIVREYILREPIGYDRVHPNAFGHHIMAEQFLYSIEAKSDIDVDAVLDISQKNKERFSTEQLYRKIMFLEHNNMGWQYEPSKKIEERKTLLHKRAADKNDEVWIYVEDFDKYVEYYEDNVDFRDEIQGKIIKQTLDLYR